MYFRYTNLLSLLLATAVAGAPSRELQEAEQAPTSPPTIIEYWDPVFGYEDHNGNIIEVSSLPPDIAAQQANTPVYDEVDVTEEVAVETQEIVVESTTSEEPPLIVEDYEPVYGYTNDNGNTVEVNELPADIAEEQANTPVGEVNTAATAESTTEEPPRIIEDYEPVFGYTDEDGNIVEVDELPADIAEEQANTPVYEEPIEESPVAENPISPPVVPTTAGAGSEVRVALISFLSGAAFALILGGVFLYCHFHQQNQQLDDSASPSSDEKTKNTEYLEATENSEGSYETENDDDDDDRPIILIRCVESGSSDAPKSAELAQAIAAMRRKEQEALNEVYSQEGIFVI